MISGLEVRTVSVFDEFQPLTNGKYNYHFIKSDLEKRLNIFLIVKDINNDSSADSARITTTTITSDLIEPTVSISSDLMYENNFNLSIDIIDSSYRLQGLQILVDDKIIKEITNSTEKEYTLKTSIEIKQTTKIDIDYQFYDGSLSVSSDVVTTSLEFDDSANNSNLSQGWKIIIYLGIPIILLAIFTIALLIYKRFYSRS